MTDDTRVSFTDPALTILEGRVSVLEAQVSELLAANAQPAAPAEITDAEVEAFASAYTDARDDSGYSITGTNDAIRAGLAAFLAHRGERT